MGPTTIAFWGKQKKKKQIIPHPLLACVTNYNEGREIIPLPSPLAPLTNGNGGREIIPPLRLTDMVRALPLAHVLKISLSSYLSISLSLSLYTICLTHDSCADGIKVDGVGRLLPPQIFYHYFQLRWRELPPSLTSNFLFLALGKALLASRSTRGETLP